MFTSPPEVGLGNSVRGKRRRFYRKRLCRPGLLAGYVARRYRALLNRKQRLSGLPVKDKDEARFREHDHGRHVTSIAPNVDEDWRRRYIVVPKIMVHGLELPLQPPGLRFQGDDGVRVKIGAVTITAVVIRACRAHWQENQSAYEIRGDRGPDVGGPGVVCSGLPRLGAGLTLRGDGAKGPAKLAIAGVERAHDSVGLVRADRIGAGRPDDDRVADYRSGRRHADLAPIDEVSDTLVQVNVCKAGAALAGARVERDQSRVERGEKNPRRTSVARTALPGGDATVSPHVDIPRVPVETRIESPELLTRLRIQRDHAVGGRREDQPAAHENGRGLRRCAAMEGKAAIEVVTDTVPIHPRLFELVDVAGIDLCERGIAATSGQALGHRPGRRLCLGSAYSGRE